MVQRTLQGARGQMMGARVKRKEDPRLLTGSSMYVSDLRLNRMLEAGFHRSPFAHARIKSVDTSAAERAPGVHSVYTYDELMKYGITPKETVVGELADVEVPDIESDDAIPKPVQPALAQGKVRWAGEAVAVVLADTEQQAIDAAQLIEVDYDVLPAVTDIEAAMADGAPQIWDEVPNNIALTHAHAEGDVAAAIASADVVVSQRMHSQRLVPLAMEGRGIVAAPDPLTGGMTVWVGTQAPHFWRDLAVPMLGLTQAKLRVIVPEMGGGFGSKFGVYPEEFTVAALAQHLGRPVRWIESRAENFLTTNHGRAQFADLDLAATSDGTITGLRMRIFADGGAYPAGIEVPFSTVTMAVGCYSIPAVDLSFETVYTNTTTVAAYRGAGRPEAAYYIERAVDMLARELDMDPVELRRKNFIQPEAFPVTVATGERYDTGEYDKALTHALEFSAYNDLLQARDNARNEGRIVGIGLASYVEICGFGPWESSIVKVEPGGSVSVYTGISPHGQGQETTFAQMVADRIGADFEDVVVHHGDTDNTAQGNGTGGSRGLVVGGSALMLSLNKIRDKADAISAHLLEVSAADIVLEDQKYQVAGAPDRSVTLSDIAGAAYGGNLPEGVEAGLETVDYFSPEDETFPFGTHIAMVEIDPDTGKVELLKFVAVDDCGNVISPLLLEGQIHGGIAQGIGQALVEHAVYDESGQLLTGSLMDYAMPKADLFPVFETDQTVTPSPLNPLGAKGIGEAATIGSTPAVVNAVMDALAPHGVAHLDMPLSAPKIWQALQ